MQYDSVIDLPRAWGHPLAKASIKLTPGDFIVRELLDIDFDGQGEHIFLHIRKCALNTSDVQLQLQREFKCASVDMGVSGLKDKNALTDQWFSVRSPLNLEDTTLKSVSADAPVLPGEFAVLESVRHSRKLRHGAHRGNRFIITLRNITAPDQASVAEQFENRLDAIKAHGFVNYFGPQRFGINQQNLVKAERYFANPKRKMSRVQRSLVISSARSLLFNQVCAERVRRATWNQPLGGEPLLLDGSRSFFINDLSVDNAEARCQEHDVHPTGPLWGAGDVLAEGDCRQMESEILQPLHLFSDGLEKAGLKQQRRSLRATVAHLQWHWSRSDALTLDFNLLKGVYATSFLAEIVIN